jgi:mono/diheme cytochrome c family protein
MKESAAERSTQRTPLGAVVVAVALPVFAAAAAAEGPQERIAPSEEAAQVDAGRRLAELHCAGCHAPGREGESRNPDAPPLRTLAERYPATLLAEAFPQRMAVGHPAMPEFSFDQAEIDALLAYLLAIQERQGA